MTYSMYMKTSQTVAMGEALYRLSKVVDFANSSERAYSEVSERIALKQLARKVSIEEESSKIPETIGRRCKYGTR